MADKCVWKPQLCWAWSNNTFFVHPRLFASCTEKCSALFFSTAEEGHYYLFHPNAAGRSHSAPCRAELRPQMVSHKCALSVALGRAPPVCVRVSLCTWRTQQRKLNAPSFNASNVCQRSLFCHGQLYLHLSDVTKLCHTHTHTHTRISGMNVWIAAKCFAI